MLAWIMNMGFAASNDATVAATVQRMRESRRRGRVLLLTGRG